ncbi:hypothetical protein JWG42_09945 [Desulfoprunum benzoelyticum]|uniref:Uncharacterized protein n=1 Tax=Desulfoprunum benzoelyticum TaxID=1506996 RepID=A0A840URC0_9BACT|nr:hypothetical protein [Desulfoprunum benzoelyticum]MBB5347203.1 hypothetical protein [Desulfoprunum benzoelyticum]MBM9530471.1 hypothetical protein [Desulfoprunum benzoelyticum]
MRCPKCGFISFDQLPKCGKCGKDFNNVADLVHGTAFSVTAPLFLKIQDLDETKTYGEDIRISDEVVEDFEVQDPDLEILFDDQEPETIAERSSLQMETGDESGLRDGMELPLEPGQDEEGDIAIDLSQFENDLKGPVLGGSVAAPGSGTTIGRELPEELADISDLAPPPRETFPPVTEKSEDGFDFSLDLDTDDLEGDTHLAVSKSMEAQPAAKQDDDEFDFSLDLDMDDLGGGTSKVANQAEDELDFSLDLGIDELKTRPDTAGRKASSAGDIDPELDFDLDLGGLTLDKD